MEEPAIDSHHGQSGLTRRNGQALLPSFYVFAGSYHRITGCEDLVAEVTANALLWRASELDVRALMTKKTPVLLPTSLSSP